MSEYIQTKLNNNIKVLLIPKKDIKDTFSDSLEDDE